MLYTTHLLPRGYNHTKNEMIPVNIVEVIERTQIRLDKVNPIPQTTTLFWEV